MYSIVLGALFHEGKGNLARSYKIATHYLKNAVEEHARSLGEQSTIIAVTAFTYAMPLLNQSDDLYSVEILGFKSLPRALYWMRQAAAAGEKNAQVVVKKFEEHLANKCACCQKKVEPGEKFLCCGKIFYVAL